MPQPCAGFRRDGDGPSDGRGHAEEQRLALERPTHGPREFAPGHRLGVRDAVRAVDRLLGVRGREQRAHEVRHVDEAHFPVP